jgi:tagatose-6-phosphate ketose/aldose isomerase
MKYLNYDIETLKTIGGYHTAKEISNQPRLWKETYLQVQQEKEKIDSFLSNVKSLKNLNVILTGAGTSAFIGETLEGIFQRNWEIPCKAVGTTEILTHPANYFIKSQPTLLISFACSGDSPESLATIKLAEEYCNDLYLLSITCNKQGALAKNQARDNSLLFCQKKRTTAPWQ